jgi:GNAT superfamily N-acetyltransferase
MGFNDPLDAEHYAIMVRNFNPADLLNIEHVYEWILLAAHVVGAWLLFSAARVPPRLTRWFFVVQAILFPLAFVALPFWPFLIADCIMVRMDREEFVDIPFVWAVSHPVWVIASLFIALAYRGAGLGLARLWHAFTRTARDGTRTFINALR